MATAVFKQYGKTVLVIFTVLLLLIILGKIGVNDLLGMQAEVKDTDYETFSDMEEMKNYTMLKTPQIVFSDNQVYTGERVNLDGEFSAEGSDGNPAGIKIMDIREESGNSILDRNTMKTDAFVFKKSGVYNIYVKAVDGNNRISTMKCRIPVAPKRREK